MYLFDFGVQLVLSHWG